MYDTAFLMFRNYADRAYGPEKDAANGLIEPYGCSLIRMRSNKIEDHRGN